MPEGDADDLPNDTVSLAEAARQIGILRGWVLRLCLTWIVLLRLVLVGGRWRVERAELERFLATVARQRQHGDR